jgi:hypothetical protein
VIKTLDANVVATTGDVRPAAILLLLMKGCVKCKVMVACQGAVWAGLSEVYMELCNVNKILFNGTHRNFRLAGYLQAKDKNVALNPLAPKFSFKF